MIKKTAILAAGITAFWGTLQAVPHVPTLNTTGFTSIALTPGYNAVSISLVNTAVFSGAVLTPSGVTAPNLVNVSGSGLDMGTPLNASKLYYLEVLGTLPGSPDCLGARFEVNVAATKASANNTVTINLGSPTNTSASVPDLSGCSFVIREHVTLLQVFGGAGNNLLHSATVTEDADRILFFDPATRTYRSYWLRNNAGASQWRSTNLTDTTEYSGLPIRPGEGLLVFRQSTPGAVTLRHSGTVRRTPFRWVLPTGPSLVSHGAPADRTPATGDLIMEKGWKGTGSSGASDHFQIWNGMSFDSYWLRANAAGSVEQWRSTQPGNTTDYMNSGLLHGDKALFINSRQDAQRLVRLPD